MSKVIQSQIAEYPGTVTLISPVTIYEYCDWMEAAESLAAADKRRDKVKAMIMGICGLVEKAEIPGVPEKVTVDTFPTHPVEATFKLINWLYTECRAVVVEEEPPNPNA